MSEQALEREHRITPLELFFDLVFVFAFTQVTTVFLHDRTWSGLGHGLLILAVLWWAWASYAWLTNTVDAGRDPVLGDVLVRLVGFLGPLVLHLDGWQLAPGHFVERQQATLEIRARVPLEVLRDTIQPFPSFSEIHAAALKALRLQIAAAGSTAGAGSR